MLLNAPARVDVFCRVIDNFGDAGVCLRLARQLATEYHCTVRLFCDQPPLLLRLDPAPPAGLAYREWAAQLGVEPAEAVISGFGCALEAPYLQSMAALQTPPRYLHLDYLSAEKWVEGTHGLDSRDPRLGLVQRFFYPGFTPATAGLLRAQGDAGDWSEAQSLATLAQYGIVPAQGAVRILVFAYAYADFAPLIAASRRCGAPVHWLICHGEAGDRLAAQLEGTAALSRLPFVPQVQFDALLRSAHRAWVRGEDSAIRALWAGVPSVWQFYAQAENLHLEKMQAYLQRMAQALTPQGAEASFELIAQAHQAANGVLPSDAAEHVWAAWLQEKTLARAALRWRTQLAAQAPDLAARCAQYLELRALR